MHLLEVLGCFQCLMSTSGFSAEAVNWLAVFSAVLESPGLYSEALMNV